MILWFLFANEILGGVLEMDSDGPRFFRGGIQVKILHIKRRKLCVLYRQHAVDHELNKFEGALDTL